MKEAAQMVAGLPSVVEREVYGGRAAEAAGVTLQTMLSEVERIRKQRRYQAKRKQEKIDLAPVNRVQPQIRGMAYEDTRSALAEEQLLAVVLREPGMFSQIPLTSEEFSAPLLGRAYAALRSCWEQGVQPSLNAISEQFEAAEMSHLSAALSRSDNLVSDRAVADCIKVIRDRRPSSKELSADALLAYQKRAQETKGLGG